MGRLEAKYQGSLVSQFERAGLLVQNFTDMFATGVADLLVAVPREVPEGVPRAMFLELKALGDVPKRRTSPWGASAKPRDTQIAWLTDWDKLHPAGMLLFTPLGWGAVHVSMLREYFDTPHTATTMSQETPSYLRIARALEASKRGSACNFG